MLAGMKIMVHDKLGLVYFMYTSKTNASEQISISSFNKSSGKSLFLASPVVFSIMPLIVLKFGMKLAY